MDRRTFFAGMTGLLTSTGLLKEKKAVGGTLDCFNSDAFDTSKLTESINGNNIGQSLHFDGNDDFIVTH